MNELSKRGSDPGGGSVPSLADSPTHDGGWPRNGTYVSHSSPPSAETGHSCPKNGTSVSHFSAGTYYWNPATVH
jgi:hypothetical protein